MRYLILSDLHANLAALEAVLADAEGRWDRAIVLGDLVGYGADPNAVVDRVRALDPLSVIRGNHDKAACGLDDGSQFNQIARLAAEWTGDELTAANRGYLRKLPAGPVALDRAVEICHGAPFDEDYYIFDEIDAGRALEATTRPIAFFGHTHLPMVFREAAGSFEGFVPAGDPETTITFEPDVKYLINPGSVGQPRDGDPRAAYGILDVDARDLRLRRVIYPVEDSRRRILSAGLPASLANRLALGR